MIYIIICIGLVAACYGGYRYGYRDGVGDAFQLLDDWEDICRQIQNAFIDINKE